VNVTFYVDNYTGPLDTLDSDIQSYFADQLGLSLNQVEVIASYAELGRRLTAKSARLFVEVRMFEVTRQVEALVPAAAAFPALDAALIVDGAVAAGPIIIRTADAVPPGPPPTFQ
jgi:hypothetical protein